MKTILIILSVIVGLMATALGTVFMFAPEVLLEKSQLAYNGVYGLSTIRGLIGGPALLAGLGVFIGLGKKKYQLLHTSALIFLTWAVGRGVSLIFDGFDLPVFSNVIIALLMMGVVTLTYRKLTSQEA